MKLRIQSINFDATEKLQEYVNKKASKLEKFFDEIDLDKMILEKTGENSFSLSSPLVAIPYFVRALHHLGMQNLMEKPLVSTKNLDD